MTTVSIVEALDIAARHHHAGRLQQAERIYRQILEIEPDHPHALHRLGLVALAAGHYAASAGLIRRALAAAPGRPDFLVDLAKALIGLGQPVEAEAAALAVLQSNAADAGARLHYALALEKQARLAEAVRQYRTAALAGPDAVQARERLAICVLLQGDWREGARLLYDYQCAAPGWLEKLRVPRTNPEARAGDTVLLVCDSGFGDTLQFVRYATFLKDRGHGVVVECQPELMPLLARMPSIDHLVPFGGDRPAFDRGYALHSVMFAVPEDPEGIGRDVPYLSCPREALGSWQHRLAGLASGGLKVGLTWAGKPENYTYADRSPGLEPLRPLLTLDRIQVFGLQTGKGRKQLADVPRPGNFVDLGPGIASFADTAAILETLDLLITSDTAVAHLAGALGRPVWVVLPFVPSWRWQMERADSPWYPTMRLFRQTRPGDWAGVIDRVIAELAAMG